MLSLKGTKLHVIVCALLPHKPRSHLGTKLHVIVWALLPHKPRSHLGTNLHVIVCVLLPHKPRSHLATLGYSYAKQYYLTQSVCVCPCVCVCVCVRACARVCNKLSQPAIILLQSLIQRLLHNKNNLYQCTHLAEQ